MCGLSSVQRLFEIFLILRRTERVIVINVHTHAGLHTTYVLFIAFHLSSKSEENVLYNCIQIIITGMMSAACSRRGVQACWPVAVT